MHERAHPKRARRAIIAVLSTTTLIAALAACSGSDENPDDGSDAVDEPVELRIAWSGSEDRTQRTQEALDLYTELNPNVTIEVEYTTSTNFWDRLTTQVAGGNAPDIIQMSGQILAQYASNQVLLPMDDIIGDAISVEGWDEGLLEAQTIDGVLYGVPPGVDGHAMMYDATKLEELGIEPPADDWTWEDFAEITTAISAAAGDGYYGSEDGGPQYEVLQTFLAQRGKLLFDEDGQLGFDEQDLTDIWTMFTDLRLAGATVPPDLQTAQGANPENSGVVQGYAAFDFTTSSQYTNFVGLSPNKVDMVTYPFADDGEPGQIWRSGLAWSITRTSPDVDEAAKLIDFLVNDSEAGAILQTTRGVPAAPQIREEVREQVDEVEVRSFEYLDTILEFGATATPIFPPGFGDVRDLYQRLYYEVAFERLTIEQAVEQFFAEAPGYLA